MSTTVLPPPMAAPVGPFAVPQLRPQLRKWTCHEFHQLGDMGLFEGQRVMLIDGEILAMPGPNPPHATATTLADYHLKAAFGAGFVVRVQLPLVLGRATDPEPDLAVVPGVPRDYLAAHPTHAILVLEISDSSLLYDQTEKASLYASAGIQDYWIVNLIDRRLEVRRRPIADPSQRHGWAYADVMVYQSGDRVASLAAPNATVSVADLLP